MDKLYRRIEYPSGKVRYMEACDFFDIVDRVDPSEGIWYVSREKHGRSFRWLVKRLEDLPKARTMAELEPLRDEICMAIMDIKLMHRKTDDGYMLAIPCANDVCDKIFARLVNVQKEQTK